MVVSPPLVEEGAHVGDRRGRERRPFLLTELLVNVHFAKLVLYDSDVRGPPLLEQVVEQGGLRCVVHAAVERESYYRGRGPLAPAADTHACIHPAASPCQLLGTP